MPGSPFFRFRRTFFRVLLIFFFFAAGVLGAPGIPAAEENGLLCLVIDSQPPVLTEAKRNAIRKGLCSIKGAKSLDPEKERETGSVVIFSLGMGNADLLDKTLMLHKAARLLYSLHSSADGLVTHSVHLYEKETKSTFHGPRTFDQGDKIINADKKWAGNAARAVSDAVFTSRLAARLSSEGGLLGTQMSAVMTQVENPAQFLKARRGYSRDEEESVRKVLSSRDGEPPEASLHLAECAFQFLSGRDEEALKEFDRFAASLPEPSAGVARVNLLLALHRFEEALRESEKAEKELGFELFLFSKAAAQSGLGKREESARLMEAFKQRTGGDWERTALLVILAAAHSGNEQTLEVYIRPFLAASPSEAGRAAAEKLSVKTESSAPF